MFVSRPALGGQDPPAKALVLPALSAGGGRDVRVMRGAEVIRSGVEDPALGVRGIGPGFGRNHRCSSSRLRGSTRRERAVNRARWRA